MAGMQVSRQDIDSVAQILAGLSAPPAPKALLSAIVTAIGDAIGDEQRVTVTVEPAPTFGDQFDTAFTADEAAGATGAGVNVTIMKVGR
jgi:hypothetical protein